MDAMKLVTEEKREGDAAKGYPVWYALDPATVYPAAINLMGEALRDPKAMETIPKMYQGELKTITQQQLDLASKPADPGTRHSRAATLDLARRIFTELLHEAAGHKPMGVHIIKNEAWKL